MVDNEHWGGSRLGSGRKKYVSGPNFGGVWAKCRQKMSEKCGCDLENPVLLEIPNQNNSFWSEDHLDSLKNQEYYQPIMCYKCRKTSEILLTADCRIRLEYEDIDKIKDALGVNSLSGCWISNWVRKKDEYKSFKLDDYELYKHLVMYRKYRKKSGYIRRQGVITMLPIQSYWLARFDFSPNSRRWNGHSERNWGLV